MFLRTKVREREQTGHDGGATGRVGGVLRTRSKNVLPGLFRFFCLYKCAEKSESFGFKSGLVVPESEQGDSSSSNNEMSRLTVEPAKAAWSPPQTAI